MFSLTLRQSRALIIPTIHIRTMGSTLSLTQIINKMRHLHIISKYISRTNSSVDPRRITVTNNSNPIRSSHFCAKATIDTVSSPIIKENVQETKSITPTKRNEGHSLEILQSLKSSYKVNQHTLASRFGFQARALSTTQSVRTKFLTAIKKDYGSEYASLSVPTTKLLDALRDLQSWRQLTPATSKAADYRDSLRAISLLAPDGGNKRPYLKLSEIESVLSGEYGVTWRLIQNLIEHDLVPEIENLQDDMRAAVRFNRVHGFGKVRAMALAQHGARTLDDLLKSTEKQYGRKISDAQKLAIRYHAEMEIMIPRAEVDEFDKLIKSALAKADPTLNFAVMGSYRRGEAVSSDIDMVVWHDSFMHREKSDKKSKGITPGGLMDKVLSALTDAGLLEDNKMFSAGDKKVLALTRLPKANSIHRQIDIRLCPLRSLPYMLLGNTGDDQLMRKLRSVAMNKGWVLNEYAMGERMEDQTSTWVKEGTELKVKTEEEIFKLLGVPYLQPTERSYHRYKHIINI